VATRLVAGAAFAASGPIAKLPASTGIKAMNRLTGLILASTAVLLLTDGLIKPFPLLASVPFR
jgi:multiple antibiotic resistance protein